MDIYNMSNELFDLSEDEYNDDILEHYGTKRHSGRYPWGSGETPFQHSGDFLARVEELKNNGLSEKEIAERLNMDMKELRVYKSVAANERKAELITHCKKLYEKGYNKTEISQKLGIPDTTVGLYLKKNEEAKRTAAQQTADVIKGYIDEKGKAIDIGLGVEQSLGCSRSMLDYAAIVLEAEGYPVYKRRVQNASQQTTLKVACPPGTEWKDIYQPGFISAINDGEVYSHDGGETYQKIKPPVAMDSKRIFVKYAEDGGVDKDGVVEIRRGVEDLSLGRSHYAQVRVLVEDKDNPDVKGYIKGMAVYSDNIPEGYDILINSNKHVGTPLMPENGKDGVLKKPEKDPENPFGALIKADGQYEYVDSKTGETKQSPINKTREEGDWEEWSKTLPSQFLAKQDQSFIDTQIKLTLAEKDSEFEEIMALENPALRKKYLLDFAGDCDKNAETLSAAALPRQRYQVILPLNTISDTEVYAPNFNDGEQVALVRFPHENTGQIPILTVNNKNAEGKKNYGNAALDMVGISQSTANRLSGADFDGDTVLVIPTGTNRNTMVRNRDPLKYTDKDGVRKSLGDFDTKLAYPPIIGGYTKDGEPIYLNKTLKKGQQTQREMGEVSNLIMDMTLKGANDDEIASATRYAMVVIDAPKHHLDYKAAYRDCNIDALKRRYKGHFDENGKFSTGASTLITKAGAEARVPLRRGSGVIDKETGELSFATAFDKDRFFTDKKGKTQERFTKTTVMNVTKDPYTLSSGTKQEEAYAGLASGLKSRANNARKIAVNTPIMKYDKEAATKYDTEVKSLKTKLSDAEKNKPKERQANLLATDRTNAKMEVYMNDHPEYGRAEYSKYRKKIHTKELLKAREEVGAHSLTIDITPNEWKAIQSGAIPDTTQQRIFMKANPEQLRSYAMPKPANTISEAKQNRINRMRDSGYTTSEIAKAVGVSDTTVIKYLKDKNKSNS